MLWQWKIFATAIERNIQPRHGHGRVRSRPKSEAGVIMTVPWPNLTHHLRNMEPLDEALSYSYDENIDFREYSEQEMIDMYAQLAGSAEEGRKQYDEAMKLKESALIIGVSRSSHQMYRFHSC
jgi:hypothetical protein